MTFINERIRTPVKGGQGGIPLQVVTSCFTAKFNYLPTGENMFDMHTGPTNGNH